MTFNDLETLLDYHYWARDRMLDAVEPLSTEEFNRDLRNSFPSIRATVVHMYSADWVWCARWTGDSPAAMPDPAPADCPDVPAIRRAWVDQEREVRGILASVGEGGVTRPMQYRGFGGQLQAQPFWQQLQHLVNHGAYHRGQVTTMLRQLGVTSLKSVDLIAFYREQKV
jgi:uncharacterized damage-inducible protein DinB